MAQYYKRDVAKILNKPERTVEYWTSSGLVIPDIEPARGKGRTRIFSERNVIEFAMLMLLMDMGVSLKRIGGILDVLRAGKWAPSEHPFYPNMDIEDPPEFRKWKDHNSVIFSDFWTADDWGYKKDLLFISTTTSIIHKSFELGYNIVEEDILTIVIAEEFEGDFIFDLSSILNSFMDGQIETVFWLGRMKNKAKGLLKIL